MIPGMKQFRGVTCNIFSFDGRVKTKDIKKSVMLTHSRTRRGFRGYSAGIAGGRYNGNVTNGRFSHRFFSLGWQLHHFRNCLTYLCRVAGGDGVDQGIEVTLIHLVAEVRIAVWGRIPITHTVEIE